MLSGFLRVISFLLRPQKLLHRLWLQRFVGWNLFLLLFRLDISHAKALIAVTDKGCAIAAIYLMQLTNFVPDLCCVLLV